MKLSVTAIAGEPIVLGDDSLGDYIFDDLPKQHRLLDIAEYLRATYAEVLRCTNRLNSFSLSVEKKHQSKEAAVIYKYTHADDVPNIGLVEISESNKMVRYLVNAGIEDVDCVYHNGLTTIFTYNIRGGEWQFTPA
jgi:hypothetical protein